MGERHAVVLFDGVCNLCNAGVNFIIDHDQPGYFRFAALQSEAGRQALGAQTHVPHAASEGRSIVLIENSRVYDRSSATLRIARRLRGAWKLLSVLLIVPRPLRDFVYEFMAERRYRWFGRTDVCRVPTPEISARFL